MGVVGALGNITFYVTESGRRPDGLSFHDLVRSSKANYAEHLRNGNKPFLEFSGPGLSEVTFTIEADANWQQSPLQIQSELHRYLEAGEVHDFVVGGTRVGNAAYVVTAVSDAYKTTYRDGRLISAAFTVTLKEYVNQVAAVANIPRAGAGAAPSPPAVSTTGTYTVKKGDCLWNIAKQFYGNGKDYTKIYNENKSTVGSNPNRIYPGQVLTIPK